MTECVCKELPLRGDCEVTLFGVLSTGHARQLMFGYRSSFYGVDWPLTGRSPCGYLFRRGLDVRFALVQRLGHGFVRQNVVVTSSEERCRNRSSYCRLLSGGHEREFRTAEAVDPVSRRFSLDLTHSPPKC